MLPLDEKDHKPLVSPSGHHGLLLAFLSIIIYVRLSSYFFFTMVRWVTAIDSTTNRAHRYLDNGVFLDGRSKTLNGCNITLKLKTFLFKLFTFQTIGLAFLL